MNNGKPYDDVFQGDSQESLAAFLRQLHRFDKDFCDNMAAGVEFTMKLEIHGNKGKLIHARVNNDHFERPGGDKSTPRRFPSGRAKT